MRHPFPFSAIAGQEEMRRALLIAAVDAGIGGVMVFGDRGTGKSTAVRGLADLLPSMPCIADCVYNCPPDQPAPVCQTCATGGTPAERPVPVVDLPLGATEDRVVGALDLEKALAQGERAFQPGLLARAHRGFLYIDEINLLDDHLVDLLLDVAASGQNIVEREGMSIRHPARFVLIGSGNPEEGELRPQLLDRFGLSVEVKTPDDIETRMLVLKRRAAFEADPEGFIAKWEAETDKIRARIRDAKTRLAHVERPDPMIELAARICMTLGTDGLRGELTLMRAAAAVAALDGADAIGPDHIRTIAASALRHRLRRDPLDESGSTARVERVIADVMDA